MLDVIDDLLAGTDIGVVLPSVFLFCAVVAVTLAVGQFVQSRGTIRRRASEVGSLDIDVTVDDPRSPMAESQASGRKLMERVAKNFVPDDVRQVAKLKRQLLQAGFYEPSAVVWYFVARVGLALAFGGGAAGALATVDLTPQLYWMLLGGLGVLGYLLPSFYLGKRVKANMEQHRSGFPDFMDLMVVCADAGLSMESAMDRVGRELAPSYPSLSANIAMTTLEMRAGRTLGEALDHLGDRLGIAEARSFATLLQQSEELGSSMTEALRIYSDDMRHQRLSRAEEKAYALPAKLVIPMGLCIFPVLLLVTILPVYVRLKGYSN
ncbi:type II secretion system F family protein [Prosthecomicrobium hirschii]|uniref:type II secretion system F family protein n=1 Tax=Prosthecodimorpha hirschii TaxID=665126 RepID=UPI00112A780E|nr:type II secretion system F family protein [Prosthecomicrobium hirschii]MCW1839057.1 type II secretion system F family protein [Prosthecomicrobium hirschii]TPQ45325.1 type II secretion protein F [Prosthecomicrobium hirschii]